MPGEVTTVQFTMPDIFHTFRKGHRLMVHVQVCLSACRLSVCVSVCVCVCVCLSLSLSLSLSLVSFTVRAQSTWFPLIDRNPQTFTNINTCGEDAFVAATQRVYEGSRLEVMVL